MEFDTLTTAIVFVAIIALGTGGMAVSNMMTTETILLMVLPSMIVFGLVMLVIGVKHGEYRANR